MLEVSTFALFVLQRLFHPLTCRFKTARFIQSIDEQIIESKLLLCGSRGMGGVVTSFQSQTNQLVLFDLEEDEEDDEEEDDDEGNDDEDENMQDN